MGRERKVCFRNNKRAKRNFRTQLKYWLRVKTMCALAATLAKGGV